MKIYQLVKTELLDSGFFKEIKVINTNSWTVMLPEHAKVVKSEEDCKEVANAALIAAETSPRKGRYQRMCEAGNQLFAVEYDTDDFSMEKLFDFLHKKLSSKDVKYICEKEPWLAARYSEFLQNPFHNEEFRKEFDVLIKANCTNKTNQTDQNIKDLALLAFANKMLDN